MVAENIDELASYVAEELTKLSLDSVKMNGSFSLALSGGSTPEELYTLLSKEPYSLLIPWKYVHVFWVDERCVPPDDIESNYRQINDELLKRLEIPFENIHRIQVELGHKQAVSRYQRELQEFFRGSEPEFDLVILGVGKDGHTASIFSDSNYTEQVGNYVSFTMANYENRPGMRVTLTFDAINSAKNVIFMVSGSEKAEIMKKIFHDKQKQFPASYVSPSKGSLKWVLDREAAELL